MDSWTDIQKEEKCRCWVATSQLKKHHENCRHQYFKSVFTTIWFVIRYTFQDQFGEYLDVLDEGWVSAGRSCGWMPRRGLHQIWIISTLDLSPAAGPVSPSTEQPPSESQGQSVARDGRAGPSWAGQAIGKHHLSVWLSGDHRDWPGLLCGVWSCQTIRDSPRVLGSETATQWYQGSESWNISQLQLSSGAQ